MLSTRTHLSALRPRGGAGERQVRHEAPALGHRARVVRGTAHATRNAVELGTAALDAQPQHHWAVGMRERARPAQPAPERHQVGDRDAQPLLERFEDALGHVWQEGERQVHAVRGRPVQPFAHVEELGEVLSHILGRHGRHEHPPSHAPTVEGAGAGCRVSRVGGRT